MSSGIFIYLFSCIEIEAHELLRFGQTPQPDATETTKFSQQSQLNGLEFKIV